MKINKNEKVIPILNNEYKVIVCWGNDEFIKKTLIKWGHDTKLFNLDGLRGTTLYSKECHPVIAIRNRPKTAEELGTLSHEATHAVMDIFEKIGEKFGGEVFAHSVGAVVRETLESKE